VTRHDVPLAITDGTAIADDDRLVGSVFVIEAPSLTAAHVSKAINPGGV
jgi:hypothetical protein